MSNADGGIKILTVPNGYGKSTLLKIIKSFASGDDLYFIRERFSEIRIFLSDGDQLRIIKTQEDKSENQISIKYGEHHTKIKDPLGGPEDEDRTFFFYKAFPFLTRVFPRRWRHHRTGEIFDKAGLLERYGDHPSFRRKLKKE